MHTFLLFLTITVFVLNLVVHRCMLSPLSKCPGPFFASISRLWYTYINWQGNQHEVLQSLHAKYGDTVRVAPNEVHLCTVEALRAIYGPGSTCEKSEWFKVFQGDRHFDLVSERDRHKHAEYRRLVAQIYSATSVRGQENYIDVTLQQLLLNFDRKLDQSFDISAWIQFWSFDTIGMMTFSKPFGFLKAGQDENNTLYQIRAAGDSAAWLGQNPWLYRVFQKILFPICGNPFALGNRNGAVREFAIAQSEARQSRGTPDQPDIMQKLLRLHDVKPAAFNDDAVRSMVATNVFGGAETTASSIRAVIYFLLKNKTAMKKLQREIDKTCQHHSWPSDVPVSLQLAESMKYLQAVVYESMRLFPANGLPLARVSPPEGLHLNGYFFPAGVQLTVYSWVFHRNKDVFGDDAMEFRPERWLSGEKSQHLQAYFCSFGYGSRACLGRNLAWMEILKAISTLFRKYTVQLQHPNTTWEIDGAFIKSQKNINVILKAR